MELLKRIDIMGPECKIKIQKNDKYKTKTGGVLTLFFFVLVILAFVAFGRDLFEKKVPSVTFNRLMADETSYLLTDENFAFTIWNQIDQTPIKDFDRKFYMYLNVFNNKNSGFTQEIFIMEKCDKQRLEKIKSELRAEPEFYYCLPKGTVININGIYLKGEFISTRLNVDFCTKESSGRDDCYPVEETRKSLGNMQMNLIFEDFYTNSFNYTDPFMKTFYSENILTTPTTFCRQIYYFKTIEYITDKGWILKEKESILKNGIENSVNQMIPNPKTMTIYSHQFVNSQWKDVYTRSYIKIQGVFAFIGGFITLSLMLLRNINKHFIHPDIIKVFYDNLSEKHKKNILLKRRTLEFKKTLYGIDNATAEFKSNVDNKMENNFLSTQMDGTNNINNQTNGPCVVPFNQSNISLHSTKKRPSKRKIEFKFYEFKFREKLLRLIFCQYCKSENLKEKVVQLKSIENMYIKKFSMEHFTNLSRKVKLIESIVFEEYQRLLLKYIELPEHPKKNVQFKDLHDELLKNINEGKHFINMNLQSFLNDF
jgi:hypothetical protein